MGTLGTASVTQRLKKQLLYFYKSLMTEDFKTFYVLPLTLWRLLDFTILRTDISSSRTKTEGLDF